MSINYITVKTLDELPEVAGKKHIDVSDSFDAMMLDGPDAHWETEDIEDQKDDKGNEIRPGLFLGSMDAEANTPWLQSTGITHVLQVAEGLIQTQLHSGTLTYLFKPLEDAPDEDLVVHFPRFFPFIEDAIQGGGKVLVHCVAGVSRSATVVIGYLMCKEGLSYNAAYNVVAEARPWINPNPGFVMQLRHLEKLGNDPSKWRSWRHHYHERLETNRRLLDQSIAEFPQPTPNRLLASGSLIVRIDRAMRKEPAEPGPVPDRKPRGSV